MTCAPYWQQVCDLAQAHHVVTSHHYRVTVTYEYFHTD